MQVIQTFIPSNLPVLQRRADSFPSFHLSSNSQCIFYCSMLIAGHSPRHPRRAQVTNYNLDNPALDFILDELDGSQNANRRVGSKQTTKRDPTTPQHMPPPAVQPPSSTIRRFLCRYCDYVTTSVGNRDKHERVHTGEKTIHCSYCDYATVDTSNYNRHLRRRHGKNGCPSEQLSDCAKIQCPYCSYAIADIDEFDRHVRVRHNGGD